MQKALYTLIIAALCLGCHKKNTSSTGPAEDNMTATTSGSPVITNKTETPTEAENNSKNDEIKWMTYDEAVKAAKKKPKKIFIDAYTDWCGWCKKMDKTTFKDANIASYMGKKYYAVKLNAESDKKVMYQGKEMTEKELAAKVFRITGYPTTVYLDADEKLIQPIPGFMDVATLDKILHYIGEDHYKTQTWEQFQMSYKTE